MNQPIPSPIAILLAVVVGVVALVEPAVSQVNDYTRKVAIVVWDGAELLDWAGPSEVFASAGLFARDGDSPAFEVYTVSKTTEPITSQGFVSVNPQFSIEDAPLPDIVVLPGGGTSSVLGDPEFLAWATQAASQAEVAFSVCTGAFVLAKAGLLDGRQVTTWYGATDRLEQQVPEASVIRGKRFVDNGNVLTTAGISAGIDGALHLVARLLGRAIADRTAEYMEYRWTPEPYLAQAYPVLNPSLDGRGREIQQAGIELRSNNHDAAIARYESLLQEEPDDTNLWMSLAGAYYAAERFAQAGAAYTRASASDQLRRRASYNGACSFARAGEPDRALEQLSMAIEAGFTDRDYIQNDRDLTSLRDDPRFIDLMDGIGRL